MAPTNERKQVVAEKLWLTYFNNYLFDHGLITEQERNAVSAKIAARKPQANNRVG